MPNDVDEQAVAFRYKVVFSSSASKQDNSFFKVSGGGMSRKVKEYQEGGENRFKHKLLEVAEHKNLVLIRGIAKLDSPLVEWCKSVLEVDFSKPIEPKSLQLLGLNNDGSIQSIWSYENALPVSWSISNFDASKNELALETIELAYNNGKRML